MQLITFYGVKKECQRISTSRLKVNICMQVTLHFDAYIQFIALQCMYIQFNACIFDSLYVVNSMHVYSMQILYNKLF